MAVYYIGRDLGGGRGRGAGVALIKGVGVPVAVGVGVSVGLGVNVAVAVGVAVGVGVGVGLGCPPHLGRTTIEVVWARVWITSAGLTVVCIGRDGEKLVMRGSNVSYTVGLWS